MSENKTNTNETENNVVENTTAETQNQNIEVEDSGDYIAFSNPEKDKQKSNKFVAAKADGGASNFYDWVKSIVFALVIVIFCLNFFFRLVDVKGTSMVETLQNGDKLIVTNFNYTPKPNDIPKVEQKPSTTVTSESSAIRQSITNKYTSTATGGIRLEVNSGRICASVVSMLSIRSTIMFLSVPDDVSLTYPSGTLESLSQVSLRI